MYIPFGPSKKQLYKIIIALLLLFYLIFLGIYKPKAAVYSEYIAYETPNVRDYQVDISGKEYTIQFERTVFNNKGTGHIIFNIVQAPLQNTNNVVYTLRIGGNQTYYTCSASGGTWYVDNGEQRFLQTIDCPYNSNNNNGAKYITLLRDSNYGTSRVYIPLLFTFISGEDSSAVVDGLNDLANQLISNNNTNTQSILASLQSIWTKTETNTQSILDRLEAIKTLITNNSSVINNIQNNTQNISDSINDSSIDSSSATDFKDNSAFQDGNGLDNIIKAPLNFIQSLTNTTCSPINLTIPFMNADVSLPCMSSIYTKALGQQLVNLIALVINGVVLYRYCLKILQLVHNAKNPNKDELEVLDL